MNLEAQLLRDEGVRLKPYTDTVGKLTIGVGRNLTDVGISLDEAKVMLGNDIAKASQALAAALPWTQELSEVRLGVLQNMAFNMGINGLLGFHQTLAHIKAGDYDAAASEMLMSKWAEQVGSRANRLAEQLRSDLWV